MSTPSHQRLPPVDAGRATREFAVRARFAPLPDGGGSMRSLILRFTTTSDPWVSGARYIDVMFYGPGEDPAGRVGWRSAEGPWLPLVDVTTEAIDRALTPDADSTTVMVDVRGYEARVSVNGWVLGNIVSPIWALVNHVSAFPDVDGFFPEEKYTNAQASGYLASMYVSGPVSPLAWSILGLSAGTLVLTSVLIGISLRK